MVFGLGRQLVRHVLPGVVKHLRVLWNEVIAFVFFCLAVIASPSAYRTIRDFDGEAGGFVRALLSCSFALIMFWFGVSSFRRARKISRS